MRPAQTGFARTAHRQNGHRLRRRTNTNGTGFAKRNWKNCSPPYNAKALLPYCRPISFPPNCPPNPSCLVFTGGYQSFARLVFPLLEKYNLRAGTVLHAGLAGQYDAWQKPDEGPWQSLLTAADIKHLQAGGRVEFISSTVDGLPLAQEDDTRACWQLTENKTRMEHLHKLPCPRRLFPRRQIRAGRPYCAGTAGFCAANRK